MKDYDPIIQIKPTKDIFLGACIVEALTSRALVQSVIMTERLPVASDRSDTLKGFKDMQYLLITGIKQFHSRDHMILVDPCEHETEALKFLDTLGLSRQLNHYILKSENVDITQSI